MTRKKGYFYNIPRFYRWTAFDHICYGYVRGLLMAFPSMSVTAAIKQFLFDFNLCEEIYCFDNARTTYYKLDRTRVEMEMGFDPDEDANRIIADKMAKGNK